MQPFLDDDIIHLCDPSKNFDFVSPSKQRFQPYGKEEVVTFYVLPWTLEEVTLCCTKLYHGFSDTHKSLYDKWGGCIRRIISSPMFRHVYDDTLLQFLQTNRLIDAMKQLGDDQLAYDLNKADQWAIHRWPLVDYNGKVNYEKCTLDFPSSYVKTKVADRLRSLGPDMMAKLGSDNILLGNIYEHEVRKDFLQAGHTVEVGDKCYRIGQHMAFTTSEIFPDPAANTLYIPLEPNKKGIDFVMPPLMFQSTISASPRCIDVMKQFPNVDN